MEITKIEFTDEGCPSFSQILGSDGNQSDVADDNTLLHNLQKGGHLEHTIKLFQPTFAPGAKPTAIEPALGEFQGSLSFELGVASIEENGKNASWKNSIVLKKLFIKMDKEIILQFSWKPSTHLPLLFIRATPVYTSPDFVKAPVTRCPNHRTKETEPIRDHVLRVVHPEAIYEEDPVSKRFSVKVATSCNGLENVTYKFACQTSCTPGMERRHIQVIFTLEDPACNVLGRAIWGFKICSSPNRDKSTAENAKDCTEDEGSTSSKIKIQKKQALSPAEEIDDSFFQLVRACGLDGQHAIKMVLAGRFSEMNNSPDPAVKAAYKNLWPH